MPGWKYIWLRVVRWALRVPPPRLHGGSLAFVPPAGKGWSVRSEAPSVRQVFPPRCVLFGARAAMSPRVRSSRLLVSAQVHLVCAPSLCPDLHEVPLVLRVPSRESLWRRATFSVIPRVLLCRRRPVVCARVRPLTTRPALFRGQIGWHCEAPRWEAERSHCGQTRSTLAWRLPIARRAFAYGQLKAPYRQECQEALQRAAKGYAQVQYVYYPVPVQAVAHIEIDDQLGTLYVYPRQRQGQTAFPTSVWVVVGRRVSDGKAVRAVWRGK